MLRRDALRLLAATTALPVLDALGDGELVAFGRRIHAAARGGRFRVLDAGERAAVAAAAERIIPATDTPGASDAQVDRFVDAMLAGWYPPADRDRFLAGLAELDVRARRAHGRAFADCVPAAQTALLTTLDDEVTALRRAGPAAAPSRSQRGVGQPDADQHWFAMLKYLTIWGYFTSEAVQTRVLRLYPLPGRYDGCAHV